jgi:large subunit ribosomal protein L24e
MVVKTDPCAYSEMKIYPGRGSRFASKDGKVHMFISTKVRSLYFQRIKPVKLTWTQASRKFNKKVRIEDIQKKRTRRKTRVQKSVVGMSLDDIKRKRQEDVTTRDKALEATKAELKARNAKKVQSKMDTKKKPAKKDMPKNAPPANVKQPKAPKKR